MSEKSQLGPSQDGTVMLDIGGDVGALIIHTSAERAGCEIELSVAGTEAPRTHVAVRERRGLGLIRYAAIYPSLRANNYTIWGHNGQPADTVAIAGGHVTELDWRVS